LTSGVAPSGDPTNVSMWVSVPTHSIGAWQGQMQTILTMWEADRLPESFRETLHAFDMLMVPSEQNVELFSKYHDNVELVLLGVDPDRWHYAPPPTVDNEFRFLISGRGSRKGVDVAYNAFKTVFNKPMHPTPKLMMKSLKGHGDYYSANVEHLPGLYSPDGEVELYQSAHCYLQPSRGEGFGLQPLQAMALGRPTILTNAHGHASFAKLGVPISTTMARADYFIYGDAGQWWEPDFEEVCEAMWDVYQNYDTHVARARESAKTIARDFTWANTTQRVLDLLGDEMGRRYTGDGTWLPTEPVRYKIVTNQDWLGEIAGRKLHFKKGQEYYDLADVKRIFFDAGVLDPVCIDDDGDILAPQQVDELPEYNAAHSHCPTCGQELNSQPTRADKILAELEAAG
jgi:hypothetical protein